MSYKLKAVRFRGQQRKILLQNENGPCPLLAAANALLLEGTCVLSPASIANNVASLADVTNLLANQAMINASGDDSASFYVDELVRYVPTFQYGMDVNPLFTSGVTGFEYTAQHTAFDLLRFPLVHGWLVDPVSQPDMANVLKSHTYNQWQERLVAARTSLPEQLESLKRKQKEQATEQLLIPMECDETKKTEAEIVKIETQLHEAVMVQDFFDASAHQLTATGLWKLHDFLEADRFYVFFRNNHFGTLLKQEGHLYLLVTDQGYADVPSIVWERLDVIDGNTEYVNSDFRQASSDNASTAESDLQLALQLSAQQQQQQTSTASQTTPSLQPPTEPPGNIQVHIPSIPPPVPTGPVHVDVGVPLDPTLVDYPPPVATDNSSMLKPPPQSAAATPAAARAATLVDLPPAVATHSTAMLKPPPQSAITAAAAAPTVVEVPSAAGTDSRAMLKPPQSAAAVAFVPVPTFSTLPSQQPHHNIQQHAFAQEQADQLMAIQLQQEAAPDTTADEALAFQLQQQERQQQQQQRPTPPASEASSCLIS